MLAPVPSPIERLRIAQEHGAEAGACRPVPRYLLTEAEIREIAVGDQVCDRFGVWFRVEKVWPATRRCLGILQVAVEARQVGTTGTYFPYLSGPSYVGGSEWNGTRRSHVRFASRVADRVAA